jgi:rubrerythrin
MNRKATGTPGRTKAAAARKPVAIKTAARKPAATKGIARTAASGKAAARTGGGKGTAAKASARKSAASKAVPRKPASPSTAPRKPAPRTAPVKPAARSRAKSPARSAGRAPQTLAEFMRHALVMEMEAAQRYAEFADAMEMHNNLEVAALFRKMADIEGRHAQQIMAEMGWTATPAPLPDSIRWDGFEAPETAAIDDVHYLMQPYHALEVALANEERAERFFARLVRAATTASVRKAALELQEEEREHIALVRAWMQKVPKPDDDWANDPDPPRYTD